MSWVAVAIGGSALIGAGTGLYTANKAADAQKNAGQQTLQFQQQVYADQQRNLAPFIGAGTTALGKIGDSYANPGSFLQTPDYQFAFNQGRSALENSAAAKGGLMSGNFARGATEYGQNFATTYLDRYRSGLLGLAGLGANAASGAANNATNMSGQIGNTLGGIGQSEASRWVGGGNAVTGSLGSGVQNYLFNNALNKSSFGGGGGWGAFGGNGGAGWNGNGTIGSAF